MKGLGLYLNLADVYFQHWKEVNSCNRYFFKLATYKRCVRGAYTVYAEYVQRTLGMFNLKIIK